MNSLLDDEFKALVQLTDTDVDNRLSLWDRTNINRGISIYRYAVVTSG